MNDIYMTTRMELVLLAALALLIGLLSGVGGAKWYYSSDTDPRLATMCAGPKEPGEGMFITMLPNRKYQCWDNLK